jgi:hypothetical protein
MPYSNQVAHDAAEELFAAWERWDLDTVDSLVADDAVDERPQSGERIVGRGNIRASTRRCQGHRGSAGEPLSAALRPGSPKASSTMARDWSTSSASLSWRTAMNRARFYFADPFDPPAERAHWSDAPID